MVSRRSRSRSLTRTKMARLVNRWMQVYGEKGLTVYRMFLLSRRISSALRTSRSSTMRWMAGWSPPPTPRTTTTCLSKPGSTLKYVMWYPLSTNVLTIWLVHWEVCRCQRMIKPKGMPRSDRPLLASVELNLSDAYIRIGQVDWNRSQPWLYDQAVLEDDGHRRSICVSGERRKAERTPTRINSRGIYGSDGRLEDLEKTEISAREETSIYKCFEIFFFVRFYHGWSLDVWVTASQPEKRRRQHQNDRRAPC